MHINNNLHHCLPVYMRVTNLNPVLEIQNRLNSINTNNKNLVIGEYFTGTLDEIRVSNTARSAAWINTTYQNTNSPTTFATFGSQIGILSSFSYRKKIWIIGAIIVAGLFILAVVCSASKDSIIRSAQQSLGSKLNSEWGAQIAQMKLSRLAANFPDFINGIWRSLVFAVVIFALICFAGTDTPGLSQRSKRLNGNREQTRTTNW